MPRTVLVPTNSSVFQQGYLPGCLVPKAGGHPGSCSTAAAAPAWLLLTTAALAQHCAVWALHARTPVRSLRSMRAQADRVVPLVQDAEEFRVARQHRGPAGGPQRQAGPASQQQQQQQQQRKRTWGTAFGVGALDEDDSYGVMDDYVVDTDTDKKGAHHFELREEGEEDAGTLFGR